MAWVRFSWCSMGFNHPIGTKWKETSQPLLSPCWFALLHPDVSHPMGLQDICHLYCIYSNLCNILLSRCGCDFCLLEWMWHSKAIQLLQQQKQMWSEQTASPSLAFVLIHPCPARFQQTTMWALSSFLGLWLLTAVAYHVFTPHVTWRHQIHFRRNQIRPSVSSGSFCS